MWRRQLERLCLTCAVKSLSLQGEGPHDLRPVPRLYVANSHVEEFTKVPVNVVYRSLYLAQLTAGQAPKSIATLLRPFNGAGATVAAYCSMDISSICTAPKTVQGQRA